MLSQFKIFDVVERPESIMIHRKSFPKYLWIFIFICAVFILSMIYGLIAYGYSIFFKYMGLCCSSTLLLVVTYLIWWNYFSKYPALVNISQDGISIQFRRILGADKIIEITSQNHPSVLADSRWSNEMGLSSWLARVRVESAINHSIIIYHEQNNSEEQADIIAIQLAKKIVDRTGFALKHLSCGLTRRSN